MFIWTRRMNFAVTLSPKVRRIFFAKSENDRDTFFKWKIPRKFHLDTQKTVVTTLAKSSRQNSENCCSKSGNDEKLMSFPKNLFVKMFVWTCTKNFDKPAVTLSPKIRKTFPNSKKDEVTIFWSQFFFHQKRFYSNGECNFANPIKKFSLQNPRYAAQIPKRRRQKLWEKDLNCYEGNVSGKLKITCTADRGYR